MASKIKKMAAKAKYSGKVNTYNDGSGVSKEAKNSNPKKYGLKWLKNK